MATKLGLPQPMGALVNEVTLNGPASAAGLRSQDVILAVNGVKIADGRDLAATIFEFGPNTTVKVTVLRNNKHEVIKVKLGLLPSVRKD